MARELKSRVWVDWQGQWGGYMNFAVHGHLNCTINQTVTNLHVEWDVDSFGTWYDWGTNTGYGFMNVGGIMWVQPPFSRRFPNPDNQGHENWAGDVLDEVLQACPAIATDSIFGVYATDDAGSNANKAPSVHGTIQGAGWRSHDFALNGELNLDLELVAAYTRWRDNSTGYAVIESNSTTKLTLADVFPDYYPGSTYRGTDDANWDSCDNRSLGKHLKRWNGSAWVDLKNSRRYPEDMSKSNVFMYVSGAWRQADNIMDPQY